MSTPPADGPGRETNLFASRRAIVGILTFGLGLLLTAGAVVTLLLGIVQGPGWLIAIGIGVALLGLASAFIGMVLLYRALVRPASGTRPVSRKK